MRKVVEALLIVVVTAGAFVLARVVVRALFN